MSIKFRDSVKNIKLIKHNFKEILKQEQTESRIKNILDAKYLKLSCIKYDGIVFKANKKMREEYKENKKNVNKKIFDTLKTMYREYYTSDIDINIIGLIFDISISNMGEKNFIIMVNLY